MSFLIIAGPFLPENHDHTHERAACDDSGSDREGVFLSFLWGFLLQDTPDQSAYKEQHAVVPVEGPRQADTRC